MSIGLVKVSLKLILFPSAYSTSQINPKSLASAPGIPSICTSWTDSSISPDHSDASTETSVETGSKAFAFSSYYLSYASSASSSELYTLPAKIRRLRSYLLIVSFRFGGTISLEEKPSPTCPSFVGLSRFVSNGGGFVNSGIFTTEA